MFPTLPSFRWHLRVWRGSWIMWRSWWCSCRCFLGSFFFQFFYEGQLLTLWHWRVIWYCSHRFCCWCYQCWRGTSAIWINSKKRIFDINLTYYIVQFKLIPGRFTYLQHTSNWLYLHQIELISNTRMILIISSTLYHILAYLFEPVFLDVLHSISMA